MADKAPIPEDRPLTPHEASLVRWLLEHGNRSAAGFLSQLDDARVVSRCYCGCASVDLSIKGVIPPVRDGINILADYLWQSGAGHLFGVFVFARAGLLAGLEVWSVDGLAEARSLPLVEQLRTPQVSGLDVRNGGVR
jgi:hypothetical protein